MTNLQLHKETAAAWDATAALYERDEQEVVEVLRNGGSALLPVELAALRELAPQAGRAIHLQCSAGSDALSIWKLGVAEVVGIDISERMIACARRKSAALGANARWYANDALAASSELDGSADLLYTGKGAICWIMDIDAWARVVARLLKPGGRFFIYEGHPLDWVWETHAPDFQFDRRDGQYFSDEVLSHHRWPAQYIDRTDSAGNSKPRAHEKQWTLGQIVNSLIGAGLVLERLDEYPEPYWGQFPNIPQPLLHRLPHAFSLLMRKTVPAT
jgi:SAM-dependent methyltransferase